MNAQCPPNPAAAANAPRFAAIEAGGTKFNVAVGGPVGKLHRQARFETRSPGDTMADVTAWLDSQVAADGPLAAIGLATFGPVETDPRSPDWGRIGATPKVAWRGADLAAPFRKYGVPFGLDTDVNAAALAEWRWGAGRSTRRLCYLTVGTGIGGGAVVAGRMLSDGAHPEMGHMFVRRHPDDAFPGACPSHRDCLEGLASGPAIRARWGNSLAKLEPGHPAHAMIAGYVAQGCVNIVATLAPERIVIGGGVLETPGLIDAIRVHYDELSNGYFSRFAGKDILLAELFPLSGLVGGLAIAEMALGAADVRAG
jgi:fructokinase